MRRIFLLALSFAACALSFASLQADAPTPKNLEGTWVRENDGVKLELTFTDKKLVIKLGRDAAKLELDTDYQVGRDSTFFGRIVDFKSDGLDYQGEKGDLFSMTAEVEGGKLVVKELKGTKVSDQAKALVEGEYAKK